MNKMISRVKRPPGFLVILVLLIASNVTTRPPEIPRFFTHEADGLRELNRPDYHLFQFSIRRDSLLRLDSLENIHVEIESRGLLRMVSDTQFIFKAAAKEPYTFPIAIVIPDNDTCEILLILRSGEKFETLAYSFVSKNGKTKCINADLMALRRKHYPPLDQAIDTTKKADDSIKKN